MWYIYTMEFGSALKRTNAICSNVNAEMTLLSESGRERHTPYDIAYMWNQKKGTSEPIYETETDSQT